MNIWLWFILGFLLPAAGFVLDHITTRIVTAIDHHASEIEVELSIIRRHLEEIKDRRY
jgi:hypothetical protein